MEAKELERAEIEDTTSLLKADGAATLLAVLPFESWAVVTSGTRALATARLKSTGLRIPRVLVGAEDVSSSYQLLMSVWDRRRSRISLPLK